MKILCIAKNEEYISVIKHLCEKYKCDVFFADKLLGDVFNNENYSIIFVEADKCTPEFILKLRDLVITHPLSDVLLLMKDCDFESSLKAMRIGIKNILVGLEINKGNINEIIKQAVDKKSDINPQKEINSKYFQRLIFQYDKSKLERTANYLNDSLSLINKDKSYSVFAINSLKFELDQLKEDSVGKKSNQERTLDMIMDFHTDNYEAVYSFYIDNRFYCVLCYKTNIANAFNIKQLNEQILNSFYNYLKTFLGEDILLINSTYRTNFNKLLSSIKELDKVLENTHLFLYPSLISCSDYETATQTDGMDELLDKSLEYFENLSDGVDCDQVLDEIFSDEYMKNISFSQFLKAKNYWIFELEKLAKKTNLSETKDFKDLINELTIPSNRSFTKEIMFQITKLIIESTNLEYNYLIKRCIQIISEEYKQDIGLYDVAKKLDISTIYLSQLFKKETNKNFSTYLTEYRIEKAKKLIDSGYKIGDIYAEVGFNNPQYFSKRFKKITNLTPNEYKNSKK